MPADADAGALAAREKGALTRLMVLRTLVRGDVETLRAIADEVGVTVQAVSEHLKRLESDGLVALGEDGPRLTAEGHEALRERLAGLKAYVDSAVRELARIDASAARAGTALKAGDAVGLFMEDGELVAYPDRASPSRGRAATAAHAGQDVWVEHLEGIVHLEPGRVVFGVLPDAAAGGSRQVDRRHVRKVVDAARLIVAVGPVARAVADGAEVPYVRFAGAATAVEAAVRGLSVLVLLEQASLAEVERSFGRAAAEAGYAGDPQVVDLQR